MQEHQEMTKPIRLAQDSLKENSDTLVSELTEHRLYHVELEEELLYPASFASESLADYEMNLLGDKI